MNERVVVDPKTCHGKPIIRGVRVVVAIVVGSLAAGVPHADIEREYDPTADDIRAVLTFTNASVRRG